MIYFPTNWGAKEPQNLPNHRVDEVTGLVILDLFLETFFFFLRIRNHGIQHYFLSHH